MSKPFTKFHTYFIGIRPDTGAPAVFWHYVLAGQVITMRCADAREVRPGVWHRINHVNTGHNPYPKRYASALDALAGMVAKGIRGEVFALDQSGLPEPKRRAA